jgi:peptidoglycan/xylan/chitin deacetylase (PgdA/CDA1 family)
VKPICFITTSWDDGDPLDSRIADLLTKYGLRGTFYIPRRAETNPTMAAAQIRDLSGCFEVGAHTMDHVVLRDAPRERAWQEIVASKAWLEEITGQPCRMFCPPRGRYSRCHLSLIRDAGFVGMRNVELLSLGFPRLLDRVFVLPTTIAAYPHGLRAYARNAFRHARPANLWRYVVHRQAADWGELARSLLAEVLEHGGVFHLWGHSWELEQTGQWQRLEEVLRYLGQFTHQAPSVTNHRLCEWCRETMRPFYANRVGAAG